FESVSQERLGHGRTADVAGAQEEDLDEPTLGGQRVVATLPQPMALDLRTPVVVGVAQTLRRPDPAQATDPVDMMVEALRLAADDSGAGSALLERADSVRVAAVLSWRYTDPGAIVATRLGISPRETVVTTTGGNR